MAVHDVVQQDSGAIRVKTGLSLAAVSTGVHDFATATGAVGNLDFANTSWLVITMTGNLTGAFANPPLNIPALAADALQAHFAIELVQDSTGGRTADLDALFADYTRTGVAIVDPAAGASTLVILTAKRAGGTTTYSVSFPPGLDGMQIVRGIVPAARLPAATISEPGIIQIGTGAGGAAAGNHVHKWYETRAFRIHRTDGTDLVAGDVDIWPDMAGGGQIVRVTKVASDIGTATLTVKVDTTTVTGISVAVTTSPSGDAAATGANTWVDRQAIRFNVAAPAGSVKEITGVLHILHNGLQVSA